MFLHLISKLPESFKAFLSQMFPRFFRQTDRIEIPEYASYNLELLKELEKACRLDSLGPTYVVTRFVNDEGSHTQVSLVENVKSSRPGRIDIYITKQYDISALNLHEEDIKDVVVVLNNFERLRYDLNGEAALYLGVLDQIEEVLSNKDHLGIDLGPFVKLLQEVRVKIINSNSPGAATYLDTKINKAMAAKTSDA